MYIRTTTNGKGVAYYHLVESYRDHGKVKQRTLLSLGKLAEAISKHTDKISVFNLAKDVDISDTYILGPLLILERMINTLGLSDCLSMLQRKHKKLEFDFKRVIFTQSKTPMPAIECTTFEFLFSIQRGEGKFVK